MTLADIYSIAIRHQRSTRIDCDLVADFFTGLVYHGTAKTALETLIRQYYNTGQNAFTLTGPYGSGKSTIALLITGLLHQNDNIRNAASAVLDSDSLSLAREAFKVKKGWLQIRSVGGVVDPVVGFWTSTLQGLLDHPSTSFLHEKYKHNCPTNESELIVSWMNVFTDVKSVVDGVLLIADEMGKTLEFINKNKSELHLFQDLAEILTRMDTPVIFLGLLHQSFSEYAKDRGSKLQEEWSKIQGRYNDILYNVSTDETVALISQSIEPKVAKHAEDIKLVDMVLDAIDDTNFRKERLRERLISSVPLHPLVALLLGPISKRRFSQNERSTFGFLNSYEEHGFQMFLRSTTNKLARYSLHNLWDYLETNLEHSILSSPDGHAWAEASEVISRVDVDNRTLNVLKSIALINLFGRQAKIYANNKLILALNDFDDPSDLDRHLNILKNQSAIIFRKHQSSWVIFEGSDLDISLILDKQIDKINLDHKEIIQNIDFSHQIMAKAHYHLRGVMRWCELKLLQEINTYDIESFQQSIDGGFGYFILLLQPVENDFLINLTKKYPRFALASAKNSDDIIMYAREVYALQHLKTDEKLGAEIQQDRVALKEFDSRLIQAKKMLTGSIEEGFTKSRWSLQGRLYDVGIPLSEHASLLADTLYYACPKILNELVNRSKLSGTAIAARKKLLEAMLTNGNEENLGIRGFPPEKSMYISCLKNSNIHRFDGKEWRWSVDSQSEELTQLFNSTSQLLQNSTNKKINLGEIEKLWSSEPFGVSNGVFPILLFAYLKSLGQDIAYYERTISGQFEFISEPDIEYVHKLQKSPKELAIKFIVIAPKDKEWLYNLSKLASELSAQQVNSNLLGIATSFVTLVHNLPNWVKSANNMVFSDREQNKAVIRLRDVLLKTSDPYELLLTDIIEIIDPSESYSYVKRIEILHNYISIMTSLHERMLDKIHITLKKYFPSQNEQLIILCKTIENKSSDIRLKAFARDLSRSNEFGIKWLESLISVVVGRSMHNWNENLLIDVEQKISEYSQSFLRIIKNINNNANLSENKSRNISLIFENSSGELEEYSKEIIFTDNFDKQIYKKILSDNLHGLSEFEKIDILRDMLQDALKS